jgi:hypothetical protein
MGSTTSPLPRPVEHRCTASPFLHRHLAPSQGPSTAAHSARASAHVGEELRGSAATFPGRHGRSSLLTVVAKWRRGKKANAVRVSGKSSCGRFCSPTRADDRLMLINGQSWPDRLQAQAGSPFLGPGPSCGLGAGKDSTARHGPQGCASGLTRFAERGAGCWATQPGRARAWWPNGPRAKQL